MSKGGVVASYQAASFFGNLTVLLVATLLASCGGEDPELSSLGPDDRILAFGDSLTHGTGAPDDASYPAVLSRAIERQVVNAGAPGELSAQGRERLPRVLKRKKPDLLLLCHGGNDFLRDRDADRVTANLRAMIEQARQRDVEVVLIGVPDRGIMLSTAPLYRELANELGVPLVSGVIAEILKDDSLRSDRVHPNADGYRRLAEAVEKALIEAGALRER